MTEIPKNVLRFERLMYLLLVAGLVVTFLHNPAGDAVIAKHGLVFYVVTLAIVSAIWIVMIRAAGRGRSNVMRWVFVILVLGGLALLVYDAAIRHRHDLFADVWSIADGAAQAVALGFLFTGDARDWYRKRPQIDPAVFD